MKINQKQKELIKIYIGLFILIFIVVNWNDVSWMFNYREVSGLVYDFFNPYQESSLLVSANSNMAQAPKPVAALDHNAAAYPYSDKANSIEIPSLGLVTPLVIGESTDIPALEKDLDLGAVYYPGSVLPAQAGQIVVLGHSAPPNWPHIKHDWVFTDLQKLQAGDEVQFYFNHTQYTYRVIKQEIIQRGQEITYDGMDKNSNILTMVSCWPPGKDYKRIAVYASLVTNK